MDVRDGHGGERPGGGEGDVRARPGGRRAAGAAAEEAEDGPVEELARLTGLWKDGALTDAEFADAKARLLPRIGR